MKQTIDNHFPEDERCMDAYRLQLLELETEYFMQKLRSLTGNYQTWQIWRDFIIMFAATLSNSADPSHFDEREALYNKTAAQYSAQELSTFAELAADTTTAFTVKSGQDFLGAIYMELGLYNHWKGQYFTPYHISQCMGALSVGSPKDIVQTIHKQGYISVLDPACGGGSLLIGTANAVATALQEVKSPLNWKEHILLVGQDIDYIVGLMCYIQLSILGIAGFVKIGDSLTDPIHAGDDLTNYWFTPGFTAFIQKRRTEHENIKKVGA